MLPHVRDINKLVGFAIFSLREDCFRRIVAAKTEDDLRWAETELDFLTEMRITDAEAMLDDKYMSECYDYEMQTKNHGGMTLVAPEYFDFGRRLMSFISSNMNLETKC